MASGERYVPGAQIAGRYRVAGILGRGGMGEVYRADDLKLGQAVALKFLPEELAHDEARLGMLLDEVRVARRVAHPNVCRVYDVGEADGHHFISMEYVDGEDLATLLRRIGRLPRDKAAQIARQICAGLAAAHDQGILHRDLKPANIMIDGRGRARITDFGLAREAEVVAGLGAGDGTPAYMAPEQLEGREASARSDIYALGLVLYEVFTGKQPFAAQTRAEAIAERSSGPPRTPSSHADRLDPAAEAVIMRCLDPDPAVRPPSALAVAAALPGGDPLAAALAAGETPSPEMVAAAPTEAAAKPWVIWSAVLFLFALVLVGQFTEFEYAIAPDGRPPVVLADRAEQLLRDLGHDTDGHASAWGYARPPTPSARPLFSGAEVESLRTGQAPPYFAFWYRSAPNPLIPLVGTRTTPSDPPRTTPGSAMVITATDGTLVALEIWPDAVDAKRVAEALDWDAMLALAGLDAAALKPGTEPPVPPMFVDTAAAWDGTYSGGRSLRVEAGATAGKVQWFRTYSPELGDPERVAESLPAPFLMLLYLLFATVSIAGVFLARTNLRNGRGDPAGAWRVAAVVGGSMLAHGIITASHGSGVAELDLLRRLLNNSLLVMVLTGVFYLGLEPMLRRWWPHRIVSWSRALEGRFADPLVGQDVVVGAVGAGLMAYLDEFGLYVGQLAGLAPKAWATLVPPTTGWGVGQVVGAWPQGLSAGLILSLGSAVALLLGARLLRSEVVAAALFALVMAFGLAMRDGVTDPSILVGLVMSTAVGVGVLVKFGFLAFATTTILSHVFVLNPPTLYSESWLSTSSTALALSVVALAAYGAWIATRSVGRPTIE